jgi:hypothetical protein
MALRVDSFGNRHSAIYYRIPTHQVGNAQPTGPRLLEASGLPAEQAHLIREDLNLLGSDTEVAVIGMDQGSSAACVGAIKVDPADVSVAMALRFLATKCVSPDARSRVESLASALRARKLSYLGLKYTAAGFAGWRAYFSSEPAHFGRTRIASVVSRTPLEGKPRFSQY